MWLHIYFLDDKDNGLTTERFRCFMKQLFVYYLFVSFLYYRMLFGQNFHCFFPAVLPLSWSTSISFFFTVVESSLKEYDQGKQNQRERRLELGRGSVRTRGQTLWFSRYSYIRTVWNQTSEFFFFFGGGL